MRRALAGIALLLACSRAEMPDVYGVRLGMSPRDVRERFSAGEGTWAAEPARDDYAIRWNVASPHPPDAPVSAVFEFHMGVLVAVTAELPRTAPLAAGEARVVTRAAVLSRQTDGERVHARLLARDCPTHADEAARLSDGAK